MRRAAVNGHSVVLALDRREFVKSTLLAGAALATGVLSVRASEAAALGGPSANGILVPSFAPLPSMTIQQRSGNATIAWPASYVGYALEQSDILVTPQWKPVAGITNNSVVVSATGANKFFRLVQ